MWQNRFDSRLDLEPTASRYLLVYLLILHLLAAVALVQPLRLPGWGQTVIGVLLLLSLLYRAYLFYRERQQSRKLVWRQDGKWDYEDSRDKFEYADLLPGSYVTRFLIVLQLQSLPGQKIRILLLPDMLPPEQWHQLWLRLRFAAF